MPRGKKRPRSLRSLGLASLLVERQRRQGDLILAPGRVRSKKKQSKKTHTKKSAPPKTHHERHSSPATATTSRRHVMKHVPRVSPHSHASIDPEFVEISLVQLSRSVKTTNVTHTHTHRQTNEIMAPCTHPGMKRLFCLKAKNGLVRFAPSAWSHY